MKKIVIGFIMGCMLTFSMSVNAAEIGNQLTKIYNSATGGKIDTFDKDNNLNARLGSERGDGDNTGGTLVLYNHSESKPRIALGLNSKTDAGIINLLDTKNNTRACIKADDEKSGPTFFLADSNQKVTTYFTLKEGFINNEKVIIKDYLEENYIKKDEVQSMIDEAVEKALKK